MLSFARFQYSSEEEEEDLNATAAGIANKQKKELAKVDHTSVQYTPFRKNFYVEVPEIAKMSPEEVEAYKEVKWELYHCVLWYFSKNDNFVMTYIFSLLWLFTLVLYALLIADILIPGSCMSKTNRSCFLYAIRIQKMMEKVFLY